MIFSFSNEKVFWCVWPIYTELANWWKYFHMNFYFAITTHWEGLGVIINTKLEVQSNFKNQLTYLLFCNGQLLSTTKK